MCEDCSVGDNFLSGAMLTMLCRLSGGRHAKVSLCCRYAADIVCHFHYFTDAFA
jgi:hypothetical protein